MKFKKNEPVIYENEIGKAYRAKVKCQTKPGLPGSSVVIEYYSNDNQLVNAVVKPGRLLPINSTGFGNLFGSTKETFK